jgi:peptidyl-prolyl cis-trans isomerase SurA
MDSIDKVRWQGMKCLYFAFWLLILGLIQPGSNHAEVVDRIVALVNNDIILQSDLEKALQPLRQSMKRQGLSEAQQGIYLADQKRVVLDQLVNEKLTDEQVERLNIAVGEAEISETIERIKAVNRMSDEQLRHMLEMDGLTYEKYREEIKGQLLRQKLVNWEVRSKIVITEADVKAYYEKNSDRYQGKTQYHLRHILLKIDRDAAQSERQRAMQLMQQIHERLRAGESFSQLAVVYSQASSAEKGGDLGIFESRLLAQPIREALEELEKGQYTKILDTEFGLQIFYVEDVIHTGGKPLDEVRKEIEEKLYTDVVNQKFQGWLKQLRQQAHIEVLE